jgi:hypothetical protein
LGRSIARLGTICEECSNTHQDYEQEAPRHKTTIGLWECDRFAESYRSADCGVKELILCY